jgi:hypothetical protein
MSMPAALETICVGICCATLQPISAREPNIWDTQISDSKGRNARKKDPVPGPDMLQALAAFAVLRRSAYPVVEL